MASRLDNVFDDLNTACVQDCTALLNEIKAYEANSNFEDQCPSDFWQRRASFNLKLNVIT